MTKTAMNRRTFLISGSAGVAGLTLDFSSIAHAAAIGTGTVVSVGYSPGSDAFGKAERRADGAALSPQLIPAAELPGGDIALVDRGARVTIEGLVGRPSGFYRTVSVEALFRPGGPGAAPIPYFAWQALEGRCSPPVSFLMPPHEERGLDFAIRAEAARAARRRTAVRGLPAAPAEAATEEIPFSLSLGWDASPKLRTGVYFVALAGSPVNWRALEFVARPQATARAIYEAGGLGDAARFDCIMLTVDYDRPIDAGS